MRISAFLMTAACLAAWSIPGALADSAGPSAASPVEPVASAAPTAAAAAPAATAEEDPVICRTRVETGTIGRKQKVCMTKSQWDAQREAARRFKRSVDQSRSTQPGGGG
jgi:hypothetical protein